MCYIKLRKAHVNRIVNREKASEVLRCADIAC